MRDEKCILLMTHGHMCQAIVESTQMIIGPLEEVYSFPLLPGISPEEYAAGVLPVLREHPQGAYILTDIRGGTPSNVARALARSYPVEVFSGLNLAMLIAADELRREKGGRELCQELVRAASESVLHLTQGKEE